MKDTILEHLDRLEKEHDVKIILACESGSRAWGFPSRNSDYDVRFIYMHRKDWYLTIGNKKDVIELPIDEVLDINGWDLRKSMQLLRKSNTALIEWLSSPIRYRCDDSCIEPFIALSKRSFLPVSSCHHYLSMAKKCLPDTDDDAVMIKSYLYALRTVLCCKWIIQHMNQPPMLISNLLSALIPDDKMRSEIENLIRVRRESTEKALTKRSSVIEDYLKDQFSRLPEELPREQKHLPQEDFDVVYREILNKSGMSFVRS